MEEITINMENLSQEEREQLLKLVEKGQSDVKGEWPQEGDYYYFLTSNDYIDDYIEEEHWYGDEVDRFHYDVGNCFRTKEEAERYSEHLKVCAELRRMADGNVGDGHWHEIVYNAQFDVITTCEHINYGFAPYNFATKDSAQKAIDTIGEERLKKYWFRVED